MSELEFIEEFKKLCVKYGLLIGGCGCCDSPYVYKPTEVIVENHKAKGERALTREEFEKELNENIEHLKNTVEE
jgi:hypothetical protein